MTSAALALWGCGDDEEVERLRAENERLRSEIEGKEAVQEEGWAKWEANPEPYGGAVKLGWILRAEESGGN